MATLFSHTLAVISFLKRLTWRCHHVPILPEFQVLTAWSGYQAGRLSFVPVSGTIEGQDSQRCQEEKL
jgi:hypothetical protein